MPSPAEARRRNSTTPNSLDERPSKGSAYGLGLAVNSKGEVTRGVGYLSPGATQAFRETLSMQRREGVYAILISPAGEIIVLPSLEENLGKREAVGRARKLEDISGSLGTISGGVKPGESQLAAVVREAEEEGGFPVPYEACTNSLPQFEVVQERPDKNTGEKKMVIFEVSGWQILVTPEQLNHLVTIGARIFTPQALLEHIESGAINVRPSYGEAIVQLAQRGNNSHHA